jgi:transposase-like protein
MNLDQLREQFPDEQACRQFFESVIWDNGRKCPHCGCLQSCALKGKSVRPGLYECYHCKRQFTVTTKTPMHSTKLALWKWLQAMYLIINSSKGVSSVYLGRYLGISQPAAWRMGHAIRQMMDNEALNHKLSGVVELDETYVGGKPRYQPGVVNKRGRGTRKF